MNLVRKYFLPIITALFLLICCSDDDVTIVPACGVNNPVEDLHWLKSEIDRRNANPNEDMKYCYILQAEYENEPVFVYQDCNPLIDKAIPIFNCEGTVINSQDSRISLDELQDKIIIWKGANFTCQVSI